jgi:hypothetical protein
VGLTFFTLSNAFVTALLLKSEHPKVVQSLLVTPPSRSDRHLLAPARDIGSDGVGDLDEAFGQTGCSSRGPAEKLGLTFYLQNEG